MARELWILRHADAEPHGVRADHERRLTAKGERQAIDAGGAIARMEVELELILTSPKVRAEQTARLAVDQLHGPSPQAGDQRSHDRITVHGPLAGSFDGEQALDAIAGLSGGGRALVVGHEPDLSTVVHDLTGGRINLKKGGLAVVRLAGGGRHELIALATPRELSLIATGA